MSKWFDANGTDVDAYPGEAFTGGAYARRGRERVMTIGEACDVRLGKTAKLRSVELPCPDCGGDLQRTVLCKGDGRVPTRVLACTACEHVEEVA